MPERDDIRQVFQHLLEEQPEIGAGRIISGWFFEPPNIFDLNATRRPKPEAVLALAYIVLMLAVSAAFNFQ